MKILTASQITKPALTDDQVNNGFVVLDITVKSGDDLGWIFAPSWEMVNSYKNGDLSESDFTDMYYKLISNRWDKQTRTKETILKKSHLILVCYCRPDEFCHRILCAEFLVNSIGAKYYGEHRII